MSTQLETIQKPFFDDEDNEDEEYMPTLAHGVIIINLASEIRNYIKGKSLGRVADSSVEYRFLVDKNLKQAVSLIVSRMPLLSSKTAYQLILMCIQKSRPTWR